MTSYDFSITARPAWWERSVTRYQVRRLLGKRARGPRPLIFPPGGIGLIWSARSASTTAILWYFAVAGLLEQAINFHRWPHEYRLRVLPKSPTYREWVASCDPLGLRWIRVIRDPYRRAVSSYRHALSRGYENAGIKNAIGLEVEERGFSFVEFLDYLSMIDICTCNEHHREQWSRLERLLRPEHVVNADKQPLVEVLCAFAEPGADDRAQLMAEVARVADSHHARRDGRCASCAEIVFQPSSARGPWPEYEAFLDAQTRSRIERIYAKDFASYAAAL